jgi:polar amino acid transport system substrate-binding protein
MKSLLRALTCVLPLLCAGAGSAQAQAQSTWEQIMQKKTLRLGATITEPWYFKDTAGSDAPGGVKAGDATWRGIGPVLAKDIADAMGVKLEIFETTWGNAVAALQANQFDVMFILDPTPQRALSIDFVPNPVLWYPVAAIARDDIAATTWAELNDPKFRLGVALGSSTDQLLARQVPKATISRYQNSGEILAAFQAGRIDLGFWTAPSADLARGRLKTGKTLVPKPVAAVAAGAALRQETDRRWRDYLTTVVSYYYNIGRTQQIYEEFLAFRGIDPKSAVPVMKEAW